MDFPLDARRKARCALVLVLVALGASAGTAGADAPPVGPLPPATTATIGTCAGSTFTLRLPRPTAASGRVWRVARRYDTRVAVQRSEGATARYVWLRFRAVGVGTTRITVALTTGETRRAHAARVFIIRSAPTC
jgi:hypothetical protein